MQEIAPPLQSDSDVSVLEPQLTSDWPQVSVSEQDGRKIMRLGPDDDVNRGEMLIEQPLHLTRLHELKMMASLMFFEPDAIAECRSLHLGLKAGALVKYCSRVLHMQTCVVEPNPHVINACRTQFALPEDDGLLQVIHADPMETLLNPRHAGKIDILFVDAVAEKNSAIALENSDFFSHCRKMLSADGVMVLNVYGTRPSQSSALTGLAAAFGPYSVWSVGHQHGGNKVMLAQRGADKPTPQALTARAAEIEKRWGLPARQRLGELQPVSVPKLTPNQAEVTAQSATPELSQWIGTQLQLGVLPEQLLRQMTDKGWTMEVATQALLAQQARIAQNAPLGSIQYLQQVSPGIFVWAAEQLAAGYAAKDLIASMVEAGWVPETAREVIAYQQPLTSSLPKISVRTPESEFRRIQALFINQKTKSTAIDKPTVPRLVPEPDLQNSPLYLQAADRRIHVLQTVREPRVVVFGNVLSDEECDELIELARPRMARSLVISDDGGEELDDIRTSSGMFFKTAEFDVVKRIEARLAALVNWPEENGEALQILRYGPGAEYKPHHDYFDPNSVGTVATLARGGQRVGTIIMYLAEPQNGGATVFPEIRLEVAPKKGNAVFFSYDRPDASTKTLHGGAPVLIGQKWVATKWFRASKFV